MRTAFETYATVDPSPECERVRQLLRRYPPITRGYQAGRMTWLVIRRGRGSSNRDLTSRQRLGATVARTGYHTVAHFSQTRVSGYQLGQMPQTI